MDLFGIVSLLLTFGLMIAAVVALVDAARRPAESFVAAGKQSKNLWVGLLVASLAVSLLGFGGLGIFGLAGVVIVSVYFLDVKPAVSSTGGGGPYGGW